MPRVGVSFPLLGKTKQLFRLRLRFVSGATSGAARIRHSDSLQPAEMGWMWSWCMHLLCSGGASV